MEDVDRIFLPYRTYKLKPTWTIERIVWIGFLAKVGDGYGSFFGLYVDFISYLILRQFALFS